MGLLMNVLLLIVTVVIIYLVFNYFTNAKSVKLSGVKSGTQLTTVKASQLPSNKSSNNYAYSIWFYVNNWKYRLADKKILLNRTSNTLDGESNPLITLAAYENNININVSTYSLSSDKYSNPNDRDINHECTIRNFPLQKWVNLIVSLNSRTLDVYLDGKLIRTCLLPGVAKIDPAADIHITPNGGFSGQTSNLQYFAHPLNPQEAYNIYKDGYASFGFGNIFEKYKIKISYLVDNNEKGSLVI
jgi:hypothetical protein